jgi:hypothetical protein
MDILEGDKCRCRSGFRSVANRHGLRRSNCSTGGLVPAMTILGAPCPLDCVGAKDCWSIKSSPLELLAGVEQRGISAARESHAGHVASWINREVSPCVALSYDLAQAGVELFVR